MIKIAVGTTNPAKVEAVKAGFQGIEAVFSPVSVPSGVADQPFSDEETIMGAVNRAQSSLAEAGAEIGIGLEGGVTETPAGLFLCNWGALADETGSTIVAGGARILLPEAVANAVRSGSELGIVMAEYTKKLDVSKKEGAIGVFTDGLITRRDMFSHIVKLLAGQYNFWKNKQSF